MIKLRTLFVLSLLASIPMLSFAAGDAAAGKEKATLCAACHGENGISPNDLWPNLAGQKEGYIIKQLKALRAGDRKDPMMQPMAAPLSDEDIENLAAYFSSLGSN